MVLETVRALYHGLPGASLMLIKERRDRERRRRRRERKKKGGEGEGGREVGRKGERRKREGAKEGRRENPALMSWIQQFLFS